MSAAWSSAPETASAAPAKTPPSTRGNRMARRMLAEVPSAPCPPRSASQSARPTLETPVHRLRHTVTRSSAAEAARPASGGM